MTTAKNVSLACKAVLVMCTLLYTIRMTISSVPSDCSIEDQLLRCVHSVPKQIPSGIRKVFITKYNTTKSISKDDYSGWSRVVELDINIDQNAVLYWCSEANTTLSFLKNLKTLGIHGRHVYCLGMNIFAGLDNLESIDLSGCIYLSFQEEILPSILNASLPKLTSINLAGVETGDMEKLVINNEAVDMLIRKSITSLSLRDTNILLSNLHYNRSLPLRQLNIANLTFMEIGKTKPNIPLLFSNLKTLNFSETARYDMMPLLTFRNRNISNCRIRVILRDVLLENFYANKATLEPKFIINSVIDLTKCYWPILTSLKRVHLRYNRITILDAELKLPKNNLEEVDLSHNNIKFISPMFTKDATSIRNFYIAYNNLHQMEHTSEFLNLLKYFTILEEFIIAHNHLTFVPREMFSSNRGLRKIDLSQNYLETVNFRVDHLTNLTLLNLKGNRIKSLPEQFRSSITVRLHLKDTGTETDNTGVDTDARMNTDTNTDSGTGKKLINLADNDLECSCDTKNFVTWMIEYIQPSAKRAYSCRVDGEVKEINNDILEEIEYLCIRTATMTSIAVSSCIFVTLVAIGVGCTIRAIRVKRQRDLRQNYLDAFREEKLFHGKTLVKYITFLAHSSADVAVVTRIIHDRLNDAFNAMAGVKRSTVCLGDRHFLPGFSIIEQTMQCLEQSCTAIVVVSEAFCRSQWCEMELREAYELRKPIVLIFTENIDENLMSSIMLNIFRRQTRATLYNRDGEYVLEPSWNVLCEAVVTLASMHHHRDRGKAEAVDEMEVAL